MPNEELSRRIGSLIEELIRMDKDEAAAFASVLLAAQVALREGFLTKLSVAAWEIVDHRGESRADVPSET